MRNEHTQEKVRDIALTKDMDRREGGKKMLTDIALATNHLLGIVLACQSLKRRLDDTASET